MVSVDVMKSMCALHPEFNLYFYVLSGFRRRACGGAGNGGGEVLVALSLTVVELVLAAMSMMLLAMLVFEATLPLVMFVPVLLNY